MHMNERRRFLYLVSSSAVAAGLGCGGDITSTTDGTGGSAGAGAGGSAGAGTGGGGAGGGGAGGTGGGGAGGTGGAGGMTTTTSATCGGGGASSSGTNNDKCKSDAGVFDVGKPADYAGNGFHKVANLKANCLIVRDDKGLWALSSLCTHECCDMDSKQGGLDVGTFTTQNGLPVVKCNCHGSRFNLDGTVAKGPATTPLHAYEMSLGCDGILYVDTTKVVPSSQRLPV
jgi:Rieske Fe-S protein